MTSVDRLLKEAAKLPQDQKLVLVQRLLASNEPPAAEDVEREWDVEIRERIGRYDQGKSRTRRASDVFSELDRRLHK